LTWNHGLSYIVFICNCAFVIAIFTVAYNYR